MYVTESVLRGCKANIIATANEKNSVHEFLSFSKIRVSFLIKLLLTGIRYLRRIEIKNIRIVTHMWRIKFIR